MRISRASLLPLAVAALLASCDAPSETTETTVLTLDLNGEWEFRQVGETEWHTARVPGSVHTDLLENELIGDPFYRDNEQRLQWIENEDWEYRKRFTVDSALLERDRFDLVFRGLDTYADVSLNGHPLLQADNMFREWVVPVGDVLLSGENTLLVLFRSPIRTAVPLFDSLPYRLPAGNDRGEKPVRVFTRKAAYHYGWDWGPRFVTSGVWRSVHLRALEGARLDDVQIVQESLDEQRAGLVVMAEIEATAAVQASLMVASPGGDFEAVTRPVDLSTGVNRVTVPVTIESPEWWWPNGLGEPRLYEVSVELTMEGSADRMTRRVGLRTVELVTEPDSIGESFYFRVNGVPVFMKGANTIPLDHFPARVTEARYRRLFQAAADANMNMFRVWGGGIYESDIFYDLADEYGILIWQDFMFANGMFPGDSAFLANVRQEAEYQVRRLRNHPSLALWCGNNEIDEAWHNWGWQRQYGYSAADSVEVWSAYQEMFHDILPDVVSDLDPTRSYWPSSPSIGWGRSESMTRGDSHYWGVWHGGEPFQLFLEKLPRFMSEYGFQAYPSWATIQSFTVPRDRRTDSRVMRSHQKHERGNELIREYMARWYPEPSHFQDFGYLSQLLQAEGMRMAFEAHRRAMPRTMGTLYWQLNDSWPVVSWSGLDYFGRWKALHFAAKRAFAPVLVSPVIRGDTLEVWVVSDRLEAFGARLEVTAWSFDGEELSRDEIPLRVGPNGSERVFAERVGSILGGGDPAEVVVETRLVGREGTLSENHVYFRTPRELRLGDPGIHWDLEWEESGFRIEVTASALARNVFLFLRISPEVETSVLFSDNYFDLVPGRTKVVHLRLDPPAGDAVSMDDISDMLWVRSLAEVF